MSKEKLQSTMVLGLLAICLISILILLGYNLLYFQEIRRLRSPLYADLPTEPLGSHEIEIPLAKSEGYITGKIWYVARVVTKPNHTPITGSIRQVIDECEWAVVGWDATVPIRQLSSSNIPEEHLFQLPPLSDDNRGQQSEMAKATLRYHVTKAAQADLTGLVLQVNCYFRGKDLEMEYASAGVTIIICLVLAVLSVIGIAYYFRVIKLTAV